MNVKEAMSVAHQIKESGAFEEVTVLGDRPEPVVVARKHTRMKSTPSNTRRVVARNITARIEGRNGVPFLVSPGNQSVSRYSYVEFEQTTGRVFRWEY